MGGTSSISVVIPALEPGEELARAVASVRADVPAVVEIVVVDDGSRQPRSRAVFDALDPSVVVRRLDSNRGPSAARNEGAWCASGSWLVFLDGDDWLASDALERLVEATRTADGGLLLARVRFEKADRASAETDAFLPGSWAVRAELFHAVGGYDENLRFGENTDLLDRLTREVERRGGAVVRLDVVTVVATSVGQSRDYNRHRMDAALHLLARDADRLAIERDLRVRLEMIAAVNATRVGEYRIARRSAWRAVRADPRQVTNWFRGLAILSGPVARRYWLGRQSRPYSDSSRSTALVDE